MYTIQLFHTFLVNSQRNYPTFLVTSRFYSVWVRQLIRQDSSNVHETFENIVIE